MSEMVERVAKAVHKLWCEFNEETGLYEDLTPKEKEFSILASRAAIAAMREPTEAMILACHGAPDLHPDDAHGIVESWQSMIDEALR
jgi:hypothetical protein